MKICLLADAASYHTKKWCKWFSENGHKVYVISLNKDDIENTEVHFVDTKVDANSNDFRKLEYLFSIRAVKGIIDEIKPDIINAHYATSYGTIAALIGLKSYVLSLWGSDIYEFPNKSIFHKLFLEFSLKKAKYILSTSNAMAKEAQKYTRQKMYITPFGVDMTMFTPQKRHKSDSTFIIGTVKALAPVYGIDTILKAVAIIKEKKSIPNLRVRIAGRGEQEKELKNLANELEISEIVDWLGYISQAEAAHEWANMDVAVIPSIRESFGVSAVEAQASGIPVIVSNIDGLLETTIPDKTSIVLNENTAICLAEKILYLYNNEDIRLQMGKNAREYVSKNYEYNICFKNIEKLFEKMQEG